MYLVYVFYVGRIHEVDQEAHRKVQDIESKFEFFVKSFEENSLWGLLGWI